MPSSFIRKKISPTVFFPKSQIFRLLGSCGLLSEGKSTNRNRMRIFIFILFQFSFSKCFSNQNSSFSSVPSGANNLNSSLWNRQQTSRFHRTHPLVLEPTFQPSGQPTNHPTCQPSLQPSTQPTNVPSSRPTTRPTFRSRQYLFTGAMQSFTVPASVAYIDVDITGAAGGGIGNGFPGFGARVQTSIPVTPGSTLYIFVGGQGGVSSAGFNGGGAGTEAGSGGGGASDIRVGIADLAHRIIVAGGGGGYDYEDCGPIKGGNGGEVGLAGNTGNCSYPIGGGGTKVAGGSASGSATPGSLGQGGAGGGGYGGGGGGGYYGGYYNDS
jgi:hypothetical protein